MTAPAVARETPSAPAVPRALVIAAGAVVVALVALWFRYRAIGVSTLWLDDAWVGVGAHFSSWGDTIRSGLTSPGFSVVYRGWATVFGEGATAGQLLGLTFAVAAPVVLFLGASERGVPWYAALLGGGLLATAPVHVDMSTRLKQYTAEAFAMTVVLWVAWRIIDRPQDARRWAAFAVVAVGAGILSTVGALAAGCALVVCLLAAWLARPRRLRPAIVATGAFALLVGLWVLVAVRPNVHDKLTRYWRGSYLDGPGFLGGISTRLQDLAAGFQGFDAKLVVVVLTAAAIFVLIRRPLLGLLLVLPTVVAIGLAAVSLVPLGTGRTDVYLFPTYALLVAVAVAELAGLVPAPHRWVAGALAALAFAGVVLSASPVPISGYNCPDPPFHGTTLFRCRYPVEDLGPLVRQVEQARRPGDAIVVYPTSGYAYGIATRYPITRRPDSLAPTDWVVDVRGPAITVLEAHRTDPEKWAGPLDRVTARHPRVWVVGSHLVKDWDALLQMMAARGYRPVQHRRREGAELVLFVKDPSTPSPPTP